jgi:dTDP-4-amino-4,6-dideoxygalactose transaminase
MFPGGMMIGQEEEEAVLEVLRTKRLYRYYGPEPGPSKAAELEQRFAEVMKVAYSQAVTSGTAALLCALRGIGVGPGDEVIVPAYTWIASAAAVLGVGAVPILAEVDESLTLDPNDVERKISPYTKAIMPVHMRGAPSRLDELQAIATRHHLKIVEDVAQAMGGSYKGRRLGTVGEVGCYSLQFNKIITCGEGGLVATNDQEIWKRVVMYQDLIGARRNHFSEEESLWGLNFRLGEMAAAVALVQLGRLDTILAETRQRKQLLLAGLQSISRQRGIRFRDVPDPQGDTDISLVFFLDRPELAAKVTDGLQAENIGASLMYHPQKADQHIYSFWTPIMQQRTWAAEDNPWQHAKRPIHYSTDMCPQTLDLLGRAVHLNVNPLLTNEDMEETLEGLNRVLAAVV